MRAGGQGANSVIDVFAWIVLLILVVSALAMVFIAGSLPGYIAKSRNHPWAGKREQRRSES
jgi:hypothetical protein